MYIEENREEYVFADMGVYCGVGLKPNQLHYCGNMDRYVTIIASLPSLIDSIVCFISV